MQKHKKEGVEAYKVKKAGRPKIKINPAFRKKVVEIRKSDDYGSEKIHYVTTQKGCTVSQHIIQRILDEHGLTEPCEKRRGQRKYVRYQWPISNYMWHCDWSFYEGKWYIIYIDDRSRKIIAAGIFNNATTENALFVLYQAILMNGVCPRIILSDKGTQFYANNKTKEGKRILAFPFCMLKIRFKKNTIWKTTRFQNPRSHLLKILSQKLLDLMIFATYMTSLRLPAKIHMHL